MKRGLGRGLDAVFDDGIVESAQGSGLTKLKITDIEPGKGQPRKVFDETALNELATSIAEHGLIQPIVVRDLHNGFYSIVAGERRWRASKIAGLDEVPVIIIDADDAKASELALVENIQREDLNPVEEAEAYKALMTELGLTQEALASRVGKSRAAVANTLRLLNLPQEVLDMLSDGKISQGHARALLALEDKDRAISIATSAIVNGLSVRVVEQMVKKAQKPKKETKKEPAVSVNYAHELSVAMTKNLGRKVTIKQNANKRGSITLEFEDNDDLDKIITKLCGKVNLLG